MKSNLFEEGIIINGNQDTCSMKIVYKQNEVLLACYKSCLCVVTFMKVIKKRVLAKWNAAQPCDWDVQILLSNAKQYGGEMWAEWTMVMKPSGWSLHTCPGDSVFIFKTCVKK